MSHLGRSHNLHSFILKCFLANEGHSISPLTGAFLTGNFSLGNDLSSTRYADGNVMGTHYKPMYDRPVIRFAITEMLTFLNPRGISLTEASIRWISHHSGLGMEDVLILEATKTGQLEENVKEIEKGPLAEDVVELSEKTWEKVEEVAP